MRLLKLVAFQALLIETIHGRPPPCTTEISTNSTIERRQNPLAFAILPGLEAIIAAGEGGGNIAAISNALNAALRGEKGLPFVRTSQSFFLRV